MRVVIETGSWAALSAHAAPIRLAVFVDEQQVPLALEWDEHDALSLHAIAWAGDEAVGTARLLPDGHIGRLAVLKANRGQGIGAQLMREMIAQGIAQGRRSGLRELVLHAQCQAKSFYERLGFRARGAPFVEAGIDHILMVMPLPQPEPQGAADTAP